MCHYAFLATARLSQGIHLAEPCSVGAAEGHSWCENARKKRDGGERQSGGGSCHFIKLENKGCA